MEPSQAIQNANRELLRKRQASGSDYRASIPVPSSDWISSVVTPSPAAPAGPEPETPSQLPEHVKAYPTILAASLKRQHAPAARVWLFAQAVDQAGRGWVDTARLRQLLTGQASEHRLMTWRNLRGILNRAHGILWEHDREHDRLFLYSPARAAIALKAGKLTGKPVKFPLTAILSKLQRFKAYCLDAWHAGQLRTAPITRDAIADAVGVSPNTQRTYNKLTNTTPAVNIAIGENFTQEAWERRAYDHMGGVFRFTDHLGRHGAAGTSYVAWRLPNSYPSDLLQSPKGNQRRHNKKIDLSLTTGTGNDFQKLPKLYFDDGKSASRAQERDRDRDHYYPMGGATTAKADRPSKLAGGSIWGVM